MRHELRLADIGEGLDEAEIIAWMVDVGDVVARDAPVVEIMTDKSNAELPAPAAGAIVELGFEVGDIVHVGDLLAVIDDDADETGRAGAASVPDVAPPAVTPRPKASPTTRRAALERGIDLRTVVGSGPGGRILLSDLDRAEAGSTPAAPAAEPAHPPFAVASPVVEPTPPPQQTPMAGTVPLRGIRRAIARNMATSWREIPHIHAFEEIDAEPLMAFRARLEATGRPAFAKVTPLPIFVAAVAAALRANPDANATIDTDNDTITYHGSVDIGIAVAAPQGLVVPVLRGADSYDLMALCVAVRDLVGRARQGTVPVDELTGGTATITNFGSLGGELATPLIRPGETLIFGFGSIAPRPFVLDGTVVARNTLHLVVGADHRLLDGDVVTSVVRHTADALIEPLTLFLGP